MIQSLLFDVRNLLFSIGNISTQNENFMFISIDTWIKSNIFSILIANMGKIWQRIEPVNRIMLKIFR